LPNTKKAPRGSRASLGLFLKSNQKPHFLQDETVRETVRNVKRRFARDARQRGASDVEGFQEVAVGGVLRELVEELHHGVARLHLEEHAAQLVDARQLVLREELLF